MPKPKRYSKGMEGIERTLDAIEKREKAERRKQWQEERLNPKAKGGGNNEDNSRSNHGT